MTRQLLLISFAVGLLVGLILPICGVTFALSSWRWWVSLVLCNALYHVGTWIGKAQSR